MKVLNHTIKINLYKEACNAYESNPYVTQPNGEDVSISIAMESLFRRPGMPQVDDF